MESRICDSCDEAILDTKYIISEVGEFNKFIHIHCFYPAFLETYRDVVFDFVDLALDNLEDHLPELDDIESVLDEIGYKRELKHYFRLITDKYSLMENDIDKDQPSAA